MRKFSFGTRMIYFSLITAISLTFFVLQLYIAMEREGGGAIFLSVLWGIMTLFGVGGIIFTLLTRNRTKK
ncbi:hypothetical protein [Planomicrobium sp. YIM 101495]|uniref:hypothetical protein n=1 Tax=Planomicrobium sp. YIM 101495 TaxID=2665160 RepID=UPI0012B75990|nr:hypothetical protein [Planomicrobium sp. YIM 101495]MTD31454.1 hypothetical protein [Planomicrobium sp. YIM 101495]